MSNHSFLEGAILLFNKPLNWTSFDVVKKVRNSLRGHLQVKKIKVGHAGTLDPLATGLLVVCTGKFTKRIETFQGQEKEYTGTFTLGATTPSYDLETAIDHTFPTEHLTDKWIRDTCAQFTGEITQIPPVFSALKQDGKRLYELARKGKAVTVKSRQVVVSEFEITRIDLPEVDFRVVCSKGTYIRSLAYDFGQAVNSGAHLSKLCRTRIGDFKLEQAVEIEAFIDSLDLNKKEGYAI